jgi:hypothetical protein
LGDAATRLTTSQIGITGAAVPAELQGQYDNLIGAQETQADVFNDIADKITEIEDMYIIRNPNYVRLDLDPV